MFIEQDNEEDKKNQLNPTQTGNPSIGAGGAGAGILSGGTTSNPSTQNPINTDQPTQKFATVQDYLGANKAQGDQLGSQFKGKLNDSLSNETGTIDSAAANTKKDISANTVGYDSNLVNSALKDPTKVADNNDQLQGFLKQWNAQYQGPSSFESTPNYNAASHAASEANTKGAEVADAGGRKQILQDDFGVYGEGNKGLDQTLLQNSSEFGNIQNAGKQFNGVQDYLKSKAQDVNNQASTAQDTTNSTRANTRGLFTNSLTNFQKGLTDRATADQNVATAVVDQVKKDLASGDLNKVQGDLNKSSVDAATKASIQSYLSTLNNTYGIKPDLTNYYTYNPNTQVTPSTVATKGDFDKAAALQKLTGQDYSGVLNPADVSKADTWNKTSTGIQGYSLQKYLQDNLQQQDKELMAKGSLADATTKLGLGDLTKKADDVKSWTQFAKTIIDTAKRSNTKAGFGQSGMEHTTNPLGSLVKNVRQTLTDMSNNSGGHDNTPQLAGIKAASDLLMQYFGNTNTATWS